MLSRLTAFLDVSGVVSDRRLAVVIFALGMMISLAVSPGDPGHIDTSRRLQVTHWLWTSQSQIITGLDQEPFWSLPGRGGQHFAPYGIGQSLVMLPGDLLGTALGQAAPMRLREKIRDAVVAFLTFPLINASALVVAFLLLRQLRFNQGIAVLSTLLLAVATTFLQYSQCSEENNLLFLVAAGGLLYGLRFAASGHRADVARAALFLGFGLLVRPTTVLLGTIVVAIIATECLHLARAKAPSGIIAQRLRAFLVVGVPILLVFVALERGYQWYRFGSPFGTYIGVQMQVYAELGKQFPPGYPFGFPFMTGFLGPLIDPRKSMVLFDPLIILPLAVLVFHARELERRERAVLAWLALGVLVAMAFYGRSYWWTGDSCWGPRHEVVPVDLLCLVGSAFAIRWYYQRPSPALMALLIVCISGAVLVQALSLAIDGNIEVAQSSYTASPPVVPLMRLVNVVAICSGNFERWGLDYGQPSILAMAHQYPPFFALRLFKYLPTAVVLLGMLAWLVLVAATALLAAAVWLTGLRLMRRAAEDQAGTHVPAMPLPA
jgi:hypothetical protein